MISVICAPQYTMIRKSEFGVSARISARMAPLRRPARAELSGRSSGFLYRNAPCVY